MRIVSRVLLSFCVYFFLQMFCYAGAQTPELKLSSEKEIFIDVGQAGAKKLRIAIPQFAGGTVLAEDSAKRLKNILDFTGAFEFIPEKSFLGKMPPSAQNIIWDDWLTLKAEMLIIGKFEEANKGKVNIELRLFESKNRKMLVGKKYSQIDTRETDRALRRFADVCMEALTGEMGIFSSKIAFVAAQKLGDPRQLYIANFDGSEAQLVTNGNDINMSPSWSTDGSKLTFTSFRDGKAEIYVYNRLTKVTSRLTRTQGANSGAAWSADGKTIAFAGSVNGLTSIFSINSIDGGNRKLLISGSGLEVEPAYSPDGLSIAFTSGRFGNPHIFVRNIATEKDTRITFAGWYNSSPTWRPDGKKLSFAGYDRQIDRYDIFVVNPDGRQLERLTLDQGDNEKPSWSPDGRFILFQSNRSSGGRTKQKGYKLYVMNRDGGNHRVLEIPFADVTMPTWGPRLNELDE